MNPSRLTLAVTGVATALFAGFTALTAAAILPVDAVVNLLGNDYFVVAGFGVLTTVAAVAVQIHRHRTGVDQASPPEAEGVSTAPRLGADLDAILGRRFGFGPTAATNADTEHVRAQLRHLAVALETADTGCSRATAKERVARGDWTTDPVAADALCDPNGRVSTDDRLRAALRGLSPAQFGLRRAAGELDRRVSEVDR